MMCSSGKATYPTRSIAKVVCKRIKRGGNNLPILRPYQCRECGEWHLTSKVNRPISEVIAAKHCKSSVREGRRCP